MSNLYEEYKNHRISQTIENKLSEIANALNNESYDEIQRASLLSYQQLIKIIKANLSSKILPMVPINILDNLDAAVSNLSMNLLPDMDRSISQYTQLMDWFKRIPTIEKKSEVKESFNQIIENFTTSQNNISEKIHYEIVNFKSLQEEELNSWHSEREGLSNEIKELKQEKDSLREEMQDLSKKVKEQNDKITELINAYKEDYETNNENFEERFTEQENEFSEKFNGLIEKQKKDAEETLKHLEHRKDEIEKLWGIIGKSATVGNASSKATEHKEFADTMMWWTIGLMCIALIIIGIATWKLFSGTYTYMSFVWKVLTSAIILVPAFYCANISKRQRDREFQLRDFEIKIATLEPFMENMILEIDYDNDAPINKDQVKLELTKIFFDKQFSSSHNANDCIFIPKELAKILKEFAKNGGKVNIGVNDTDE